MFCIVCMDKFKPFILFLKTARKADSFISFGTCEQIFGPRYVKDSIPYRSVSGFQK